MSDRDIVLEQARRTVEYLNLFFHKEPEGKITKKEFMDFQLEVWKTVKKDMVKKK